MTVAKSHAYGLSALLLAVSFGVQGQAKTENYVYHDNFAQWVIGQIAKTTVDGVEASQNEFDSYGRLITKIEFGAVRQSFGYYADGTLNWSDDGRLNRIIYSSWKRGIPRLITFPDKEKISAIVDDNGWITSITGEAGYTTAYEYDPVGRLSKTIYPAEDDPTAPGFVWYPTTRIFEPVATAEYGIPANHWRQTIQTQNAFKRTYYDALWRPVLVEEYDAGSPSTTRRFQKFSYDSQGRQVFASYPSTSSAPTTGTRTTYDPLGRVTKVAQDTDTQPLETVTSYLSGNRIQVQDPKLNTVVTTFQAYDKPSYDAPTLIVAPEDARTIINRDPFGKPMSITRSNGSGSVSVTRSYVYQADQQLCKSIEPEAGVTVYGYDAAGNLDRSASGLPVGSYGSTAANSCAGNQTSAWSSGRAVTRTYDTRNRLKTLAFPDGRGNQVWTYTPDSLPAQVTTNNSNGGDGVVNTYTYNHRRLLVGEDMNQAGADTVSMDYGYNQYGNLAMHMYPSTLTVDYLPNALGQPTKAGSYASGVTYWPNGAIKHFVYGNGIAHDMVQNVQQQPVSSVDGSVMQMAYSFDKNGNVASTTDYADGRQTRTMTYDGLDRLLTTNSVMFGGNNQAVFTYDVLDNLQTFKVGNKVDYQYTYDSQKLVLATNAIGQSVGVDYDLQGNVKNRNGKYFEFDYGNRLRCNSTAVDCTGSVIERYRYDANGRRVLNDSPTLGKIFSLYGQDGVLRRQQDQRTGKNSEYVYLGGSLVARVINAQALPVPTTSVPASSTSGLYTVSWTATANTTGYEVQEKAGSTGAWTGVYTGTGISLAVSGKSDGAYSYRARSCLYASCGAWSNEATVAVDISITPPILSSSGSNSNGQVSLTWTSIATAARYVVTQIIPPAPGGVGGRSSVYDGSQTATTLSAVSEGTYKYFVVAYSGSGKHSEESNTITVNVSNVGASLSPPTGLTYSYIKTKVQPAEWTYTAAWNSVAGAEYYVLKGNKDLTAGVQVSGSTSYTFTVARTSNLKPGQVQVRACNASGCSEWTSLVSATCSSSCSAQLVPDMQLSSAIFARID